MVTKVDLADRLLGRPGSWSALRQSGNDNWGGGEGFASALENAGRSQEASAPMADLGGADAEAARTERSREKDQKKASNNGDGSSNDVASADTSAAQASISDAQKQTQNADDARNADAAKTADGGEKGAAQGGGASADGSKTAPNAQTAKDQGTLAAAKGKLLAGGKKGATEAGALPTTPGKPPAGADEDGTLGGQADGKAAEQGVKPVKADGVGTKETPQLADNTGGDNSVVETSGQAEVAAAVKVAELAAGAEATSAMLPRVVEAKEDSPRPVVSPTVLQGLSEGSAGGEARSAGTASAAQDVPASGSEQTFDQIVLGLRTKLDANNQQAQIVLNPPSLGRLQVSVEVANGQLTAQFHATTDVVRDLLSSNMDRLRSVLEGQGLTVDKLAVSSGSSQDQVASTNSSGLANQSHDGRSGGAFAQDRQAPRQQGGETFGRIWREVSGQEKPIDLLA